MQSGYIPWVLDVELPDNRFVELTGQRAKYWVGEGLPVYEGYIEGLPESVLVELKKLKAIRAVG
jgi:hypothetical protein